MTDAPGAIGVAGQVAVTSVSLTDGAFSVTLPVLVSSKTKVRLWPTSSKLVRDAGASRLSMVSDGVSVAVRVSLSDSVTVWPATVTVAVAVLV